MRVRAAQVGAVGAWFLRLRPWIVGPPVMLMVVMMAVAGASTVRLALLIAVQGPMLLFFIAEAIWLSRRGTLAFVTERQLARSLVITLLGITAACCLTGAWRSPALPVLLAPVGVSFAAFGARPWGLRMLLGLVVAMFALVVVGLLDGWLPVMPIAGVQSVIAVVVTALLLLAGVAGLTTAHRRAAATLDDMRIAVVEESQLRVRDVEAVGARVAHDVRNPLAVVKSLLQLEAQRNVDAKSTERLNVALQQVERIDGVLGDYVSLSKPLTDLRLEPTDMVGLVESVGRAVESVALERGVSIQLKLPTGRADVLVDAQRVRDALLNLMLNALEATARGGSVGLELELTDREVVMTVADSGSGMTADQVRRASEPFYTTKSNGTGLGVPSAQGCARQHGGSLNYQSEQGRGTTARLGLPLQLAGKAGGA